MLLNGNRIVPLTETKDRHLRQTTVAVDFDGCLCVSEWPGIGKANQYLLEELITFRAAGGAVILWTCREKEPLQEALRWCERRGLLFDAVNENLPAWKAMFGNDTRKIGVDYYIDDKAITVKA